MTVLDPRKLVVVGASLAGLRAAEAARHANFTGSIVLIGSEEHLPYDRPPLSKAFLDAETPAATEFRSQEYFDAELDIELMLGRPATRLDTENKRVLVGDGPTQTEVAYDLLVIATGASAREMPGTNGLRGIHNLRTRDDAQVIRAALDEGARLVIVGAGFIGSEIASGARKRGLAPVVLEALPTPLVRAIGEEMGARISSLHIQNGTDLRCGVAVTAFEGDGTVERVVLADGSVLDADLVVTGIGTIPSVSWLEGSGLVLENGILCDENLYTGVDGIYAAGDVVNWHNSVFERNMRIEHWTSAAEQGAVAARNAVDPESAKAYSTVPYFWSDQYGVRIQFVGVSAADEIVVIEDRLEEVGRLVALYRSGDRIVGALTVNGQAEIMKYRGMIMKKVAWDEALTFAQTRKKLYEDKLAAAEVTA